MTGEERNQRKDTKMAPTKSTDYGQRVFDKESVLMETLSPAEHYIMSFQSVLVWETPTHSIALFLLVHLLFWLATTLRVYYVIGVIGVIVVIIDMWKNHIWPEIRVPPSPGDDIEGWTPVHPRLLSVPEICQLIAPWWVKVENIISAAMQLRRHNHPKFFFIAVSLLSCSGFLGLYIRGLTLAYFIVLFLLAFPCFLYHNGWERAQQVLEPLIANIESTMRIRRTRSKSVKRGKRKRGEERAQVPNATDSDSDELEDFVPESPSEMQETSPLARATAESDDEEGDTLGLLTPPSLPSRTPSRDPSDTEEGSTSIEEMVSLTPHLHSMPAYDDTLDGTLDGAPSPTDTVDLDEDLDHDESLHLKEALEKSTRNRAEHSRSSTPSQATGDSGPQEDEIKFVTSHFSQFEEEDVGEENKNQIAENESHLSEDLEFPEICAENNGDMGAFAAAQHALTNVLAQPKEALMQRGHDLVANLSVPAVSGAVTSIMAQTVAGFATLKETVLRAPEMTEDPMVDSNQLEAEFEFLDEGDLAQAEADEGLGNPEP